MEESLSDPDFEVKRWLSRNLELSRPETLDVQISELDFNLNLLKTQLEETILSSKSIIEQNERQVRENVVNVSGELLYVSSFFEECFNPEKLAALQINHSMYEELRELSEVKKKLTDILEIMDIVLSLDYHIAEMGDLFEATNIIEIEAKLRDLSPVIKLLLCLQPIDTRYEKAERFLNFLKENLGKMLSQRLSNENKLSKESQLVIKCFEHVDKSPEVVLLYASLRLAPVFSKFKEAVLLVGGGNQQINLCLELFYDCFKNELEFLSEISGVGVYNKLIRGFSLRIFAFLRDEIFLKNMAGDASNKKILDLISGYLQLILFLKNSPDGFGVFDKTSGFADPDCEDTLLSVFLQTSRKVLENEVKTLEKQLSAKLRKELEREFSSNDEKIEVFEFWRIPEMIESSFHYVFEATFACEFEDWTSAVQTNIEEILLKFQRLLDEIDFKGFQHSVLDKLVQFNVARRREDYFGSKTATYQDFKTGFTLRHNLSLVETLISKFDEMIFFEHQLQKVDKKVRLKISENKSFINDELFKMVQLYFFKKDKGKEAKKQSLHLAIKNGVVIFDNVFKSLALCQEKLKRIILKIYLADNFNRMLEIPTLGSWSKSAQATTVESQFSINASEPVSSAFQSFFIHVQMLEETRNNILLNAQYFGHSLGSEDHASKLSFSAELYSKKLKQDQEGLSGRFGEEAIFSKGDMVEFWTLVYINFLLKIYISCLVNIPGNVTLSGRRQLKTDIEYILNVCSKEKYGFLLWYRKLNELLQLVKRTQDASELQLGLFDFV